jgi:NADH-quinone oxidoreductase subunit J
MALAVAFWILAVVAVLGALGVIFQKNVFRAALSLILCLVSVAGIFITLSADFLAAVQILVYVGAISVVIILAIMLTRNVTQASSSNKLRVPAFVVAVLFFALIAYTVLKTNWQVATATPEATTTLALGQKLFGENGFILPVEIAPVLILAVILGAIVLTKEK